MLHARISLYTCKSIVEQMQNLDKDVALLDMSTLRLGEYPIEALERLILLIPDHVVYLNLGTNRLNKLRDGDLERLFMSIAQSNIQYLSLHHNELGSIGAETLLPAVKPLLNRLIALDLGNNELWRKNSEIWQCLFASNSKNKLEHLNLSGNLMLTHAPQLATKIASIASLAPRCLGLAFNQLGEQNADGLMALFSAISVDVEVLDLQKNMLHHLSAETMLACADTLRHIKILYVSSDEVARMSAEQLRACAAMAPACHTVVALNRANLMSSSHKLTDLQSSLSSGHATVGAGRKKHPLLEANKHDPLFILADTRILDRLKHTRRVGSEIFNVSHLAQQQQDTESYTKLSYVRAAS